MRWIIVIVAALIAVWLTGCVTTGEKPERPMREYRHGRDVI